MPAVNSAIDAREPVATEPGGGLSSALTGMYGPFIRRLRGITNKTMNKETKWRHNRPELTTGYQPRWPH